MNNPYDILGIPSSASTQQVKEAYKNLARKYQANEYAGSPLAEEASRKMNEINEAYDNIILSRNSAENTYHQPHEEKSSGNQYFSDYQDIRIKIQQGRIDDAEIRLDGISPTQRNAEWYFLKGSVNNCRGWFEEARKNFTIACQMDPTNTEYRAALNSLNSSNSTGGYRTKQRASKFDRNTDSVCSICSGLLCADCCCECMGGDLIPCC